MNGGVLGVTNTPTTEVASGVWTLPEQRRWQQGSAWPSSVDFFSPTMLFASSEQGVWYDPSDFSTLFQDSAGTTPVTAVEQPVGLMLDKSKNGVGTNGEFRYSLLKYTEDFTNAAWEFNNVTKTSSSVITATATSAAAVFQLITTPLLQTYAYTAKVLKGRNFVISMGGITSGIGVIFNGTTGAYANTTSLGSKFTLNSYSCVTHPSDSGYWRVTLNVTNTVNDSGVYATLAINNSLGTTWFSGWDAVIGDTLTATEHMLVLSSNASRPYQKILADWPSAIPGNHASQSTTTARPILRQDAGGQYYLAFDGVDDFLATGSVNLTATDKISVFVGVRKLSDAVAYGVVVENFSGSSTGTFTIHAPAAAGTASYMFAGTGSMLPNRPQATVTTGYAAPITNVLTGLGNISGDSNILRVNGTQVAQSTGDQGTGNYNDFPIYIGSRGGTTLPLNGRIYSLIVRGATTTSPQLEQTEAWVNSKTGAY